VTRTTALRLLLVLLALAAAGIAAAELAGQGTSGGPVLSSAGGRGIESIFQDDQLLLYQPPTPAGGAEVQRTLETLKGLGVDRVRLTVVWYYLAPQAESTAPPAGFHAADPAAYPAAAWAPYDRVVRLAQADGIGVLFTVTAPGPLWANAPGAPDSKTASHYQPSAAAFGEFVEALGRRYSGAFVPAGGSGGPLPRVSDWSVWNEPNQPGWLAPQWSSTGKAAQPVSPRLYRGLADAAYEGLLRSGHGPVHDTILIGELAPEGSATAGPAQPMKPMPFLRALYCVDTSYRPLQGPAAAALGCPGGGSAAAFAAEHPGLFRITGFAHHPYSLLTAPDVPLADPDIVPLSELGRLEHGLDRIFSAYGVSRRLPLYLTEYGYITNPPNACRGVPPATQSLYLDEAEYMAWRDPRVRALGQFELQDQSHPPGSCRNWITFQSGLEYLGGAPKPSLAAYRLPVYLPQTSVSSGGSLAVWGMLRAAPAMTRSQTAEVQWRPPGGAYRRLETVRTSNPSGILEVSVTPPGTGAIRLRWRTPGGQAVYSREVSVTVTG
jgi:hypothetical protein